MIPMLAMAERKGTLVPTTFSASCSLSQVEGLPVFLLGCGFSSLASHAALGDKPINLFTRSFKLLFGILQLFLEVLNFSLQLLF